MNPFYEQQKQNLRTAILNTLTFPEHLHAHTEFLYDGSDRHGCLSAALPMT